MAVADTRAVWHEYCSACLTTEAIGNQITVQGCFDLHHVNAELCIAAFKGFHVPCELHKVLSSTPDRRVIVPGPIKQRAWRTRNVHSGVASHFGCSVPSLIYTARSIHFLRDTIFNTTDKTHEALD